MKSRKSYIEKLVEQGEHQQQDFKFEISDSKKIARSISAFANTDGGRLLVGVKDNGSIAGIRSDEEIHMMEAASQMYCKPEVPLKFNEWNVNGKQVLEVEIEKSDEVLISAPDKNGDYKVYVRFEDQNILANGIYIQTWKRKKESASVEIQYSDLEHLFLDILKQHQPINWSQIRKKLKCSPAKLNQLIIDFILIDVVELKMTDKGYFYLLTENQKENSEF